MLPAYTGARTDFIGHSWVSSSVRFLIADRVTVKVFALRASHSECTCAHTVRRVLMIAPTFLVVHRQQFF